MQKNIRRNQRRALKNLFSCKASIKVVSMLTSKCSCLKEFNQGDGSNDYDATQYVKVPGLWRPDRCITSYQELMTAVPESIFIADRQEQKWKQKEIFANRRELRLCDHFMKSLTAEALCFFVQELIRKKQEYLDRANITCPVTCYLWTYYGPDMGGRAFLCYEFVSGQPSKERDPGVIVREAGLYCHAFFRKFLLFKTKKYNQKITHILAYTLNEAKAPSLVHYSDEYLEEYYNAYKEGDKVALIPRSLMVAGSTCGSLR
jgi:hypothetical protein